MKVNELMIGDLVNLSPGKANIPNYVMIHAIKYDNHVSKDYVFDIVFLSTGLVQYNYSIRCLDPIPITPEILEKNVFQKLAGEIWEYDIFSKDNSLASMIVWRRDYATPHLEIRSFALQHGEFSRRNLNYVHQLQHALRLCGIEKEIKL